VALLASTHSGPYLGGMTTPRFYQVSLRTILELVFIAAVLLGFFYWRNVPPVASGRFQVETFRGEEVLFVDTATGETWVGNPLSGQWNRGSMPERKSK
jgi:hypothetical protein